MSALKTSLIMWAVLVAVAGVGFSPALRHGLDRGADTVSIDRLLAGDATASRNLTVRGGRLDCGRAVGDASTSYAPLVPASAPPGGEVKLVVSLSRADADRLCGVPADIHAVLRDIFWEGLSSDERKAFARYGTTVAPDARLLDAGDPIDLFIWAAIVGFTFVLGGIFSLFAWRKARRARRYEIG